MDKTNLPELPVASAYGEEDSPVDGESLYTAEQMHEYAAAALRATTGEGEWPDDAACIAVYDAVAYSGLTRDVKSPERKVAIVRAALAAAAKEGSRE